MRLRLVLVLVLLSGCTSAAPSADTIGGNADGPWTFVVRNDYTMPANLTLGGSMDAHAVKEWVTWCIVPTVAPGESTECVAREHRARLWVRASWGDEFGDGPAWSAFGNFTTGVSRMEFSAVPDHITLKA